jgi:hypothetical protein
MRNRYVTKPELLVQVRDHIQRNKDRFYYCAWFYGNGIAMACETPRSLINGGWCGTTACVAGHILAFYHFESSMTIKSLLVALQGNEGSWVGDTALRILGFHDTFVSREGFKRFLFYPWLDSRNENNSDVYLTNHDFAYRSAIARLNWIIANKRLCDYVEIATPGTELSLYVEPPLTGTIGEMQDA